MISGEKIGKYIANPLEVAQVDLDELNQLKKKYPYASSFQLLHLKGLAIANDLDFENQLKYTAVHIPDREHLYHLIHSATINKSVDVSEVITPDLNKAKETTPVIIEFGQPIDDSSAQELEESIDFTTLEFAQEEIIAPETIKEPSVEKEISKVEEIPATILETTDSIASSSDITEDIRKTDVPSDSLEVDILNGVIDIAYSSAGITQENTIPEEVQETEQPEENFDKNTTSSNKNEENSDEVNAITIPETTSSNKDLTTGQSTDTRPENMTFIQWLKEKRAEKDTQKTRSQNLDETNETSNQKEEKPSSQVTEQQHKTEINALLNKFMVEEPRISKPTKEFYNPVKNARLSVEESDDLVSETLAKIHVMQKNYSKAITAYEKLILLYPEKKTFFASQIEKIRKEIKK